MRKIFFWLHLSVGAVAGIAILIMCVTGVALTFEKQINTWLERRDIHYQAPVNGSARLPLESLIGKVQEQRDDVTPSSLVIHSDPNEPTEVGIGRQGSLLVDPYSGVIAGQTAASPARGFFRSMEDWHRWMAMTGENRGIGKAIMDAGNLLFFGLALSGIYLWIPRQMAWKNFRPVVIFRSRLSAKARDFNWHNVIGLWTWIPLVLVVGSGVTMSYPWASNLLYSITGSPAPQGFGGEKGKEGLKGKEGFKGKEGDQRAKGGEGRGPEGGFGGPGGFGGGAPANWTGLNVAWAQAEQKVPDWKTIRLQGSGNPNAPLTFTIETGASNQPQYQGRLAVNRETGAVVSWTDFSSGSMGQRLRTLARFTHTGETLGFWGQTIAGIATLGGIFMVYTGFALALRRFFAWRKRRTRTLEVQPVAVG